MAIQKHQSNSIEALESDYLYTALSQIPNAGNGLFTAIPIYKDEIISVFKGEILTDLQAKNRALKGCDKYFISLLDGRIMDSMNVTCFAKYANDAEGFLKSTFKNSAKIALDENNEVCIIATKNIKAGEEIFCGYGKKYWKKHALN
jgi:SET domain-containing protein